LHVNAKTFLSHCAKKKTYAESLQKSSNIILEVANNVQFEIKLARNEIIFLKQPTPNSVNQFVSKLQTMNDYFVENSVRRFWKHV
jgi:hypothetical protein